MGAVFNRFTCYCFAIPWLAATPAFGATATKLHYSLTPQMQGNKLILHVDVDMEGIGPGGTELVIPSTWGNATQLSRAVTNLKTSSPGARIDDTDDPSKKFLRGFARRRAR